jgi:predicted phosphodiesterase
MVTKEILESVLTMPNVGRKKIAKLFGCSEHDARAIVAIRDNQGLIREMIDKDLIKSNQKLAAKKQFFQDQNRIERKSFRNEIRLYNDLKKSNDALLSLLDRESFKITTESHKLKQGVPVGVITSSDLHGNELVNLENNKYDFDVLSKRVRKHVLKTIAFQKADGVKLIHLFMTGDLLNSDRRNDEKAVMATNRTNAQFLVAEIMINAILELNKHFNVVISYVDGNESRVNPDLGFEELVATDTYDASIFNIIRRVLKNKKGIDFNTSRGAKSVVNVNGHNFLLVHGHQGFQKDPHNAIVKLVAQYAKKGIVIRYVVFGHIHECYITEMFGRSSSTVGANSYSEDGLNLTSRASQNTYKVFADGSIDGLMIDLQEVEGIEGYDIHEELKAYNVKSAGKLRAPSIYEYTLDKLH